MRIHNLYEDEAGESHWRDVEVDWSGNAPGGAASPRAPASGVIFRQIPAGFERDWHPAPRRQYIIHLDGDVEVTASDGETRIITAGEIALVEDLTGKGHRTRNACDRTFNAVYVALD
jgi:oxalate decarboxylase/phosphoglucose isomerase-like protein (cupin superfamily)